MRTGTRIAFLQLVETLVRAGVGLLLGFIGFFAILTAFWQLAYVGFRFFSGSGVVFSVSLGIGGLLLWFAGKILNGLTRRGRSA